MAKIFDVQSEISENPNRNNFDLRHKVHLTGKAGIITPFFCQPVCPTDSFEISTAVGINLMPMWYPTQSNMRFIMHYFYVPYRLLVDDWKNIVQGLSDNELPYCNLSAEWYKTGSLADYLGIPTNYVVAEDREISFAYVPERASFRGFTTSSKYTDFVIGSPLSSNNLHFAITDTSTNQIGANKKGIGFLCNNSMLPMSKITTNPSVAKSCYIKLHDTTNPIIGPTVVCLLLFASASPVDIAHTSQTTGLSGLILAYKTQLSVISTSSDSASTFTLTDEQMNSVNNIIDTHPYVYPMIYLERKDTTVTTAANYSAAALGALNSFDFPVSAGTNIDISEHPEYCPYYYTGHTTNTVKVRTMPMRAYEMVYNSYYRNSTGNQPFVVDGETKYNDYLPNHGTGADDVVYELHSRNWELDAYTSCLPSPQQGNAPIVGVTATGELRVAHDDGSVSTAQLRDLDGSAGVEIRSTDINPEHPEDARIVVSLASSGLSIADFRAGNALQRFLETSLRTGYRYADFIFGHFSKSPSHQELDMPVFLGGYTQVVDVNKISNVTAGDVPLGEFAGTGSSFDVNRNVIKHYFDDFGLVLGVMTLVPDAAYSQVLPKHFTYSNRLDFYFPEFSQLGLQPITYEELCPIQSYVDYLGDNSKLITDTFGYQRPNHDLVWLPDTLHGLFRTSLCGSVINRRFGTRPVLGDDFLKIKPEECNDIFSVTEKNEDVWIGQVVIDIKAQRPIPRVVIPALGR